MLISTALLLAAPQPAVRTSGAGCTQVLTGRWSGRGVVAFGPGMKVEATATYRADGSFESMSRFTGRDGRPQEQAISGRWTATPGRRPGVCTVAMSSRSPAGSSSSTSDVQIVDRDTYRFMDIDMRRVR